MKVFRIKSDVNKYWWLKPEETGEDLLRLNTFNCSPRKQSWGPPYVSIIDDSCIPGDFVHYHPSVIVASPDCFPRVKRFFEEAGELLPLWMDGEQYTLLNVMCCVSALSETSDWLRTSVGKRVEIRRFVFEPSKLPHSSIFKIPETRRGDVLTWEKIGSPDTEFKAFVEQNGLTGLLFDELWDSEKANF